MAFARTDGERCIQRRATRLAPVLLQRETISPRGQNVCPKSTEEQKMRPSKMHISTIIAMLALPILLVGTPGAAFAQGKDTSSKGGAWVTQAVRFFSAGVEF